MKSRRPHQAIALLACLTSFAYAQQAAPNNHEKFAARLLALAADNPRLDLERVDHAPSKSIVVQKDQRAEQDRSGQVRDHGSG